MLLLYTFLSFWCTTADGFIEPIHLKFEFFTHVWKINKKCEIFTPFANFSQQGTYSSEVWIFHTVWKINKNAKFSHLQSFFFTTNLAKGGENSQKVWKFHIFVNFSHSVKNSNFRWIGSNSAKGVRILHFLLIFHTCAKNSNFRWIGSLCSKSVQSFDQAAFIFQNK